MLSSRLRIVAVLAGLMLVAPALSQAQGPGGGGGGRRMGMQGGNIGAAGLLRIEEVQKELGVTDEQKAEFTKAMESMQGPGSFNREEFRKLSQEERDKKLAEFRKEGEERSKKADESVKALLKPEQWTRLNELRLQREGVRSWSREEVQTQLALTDEQKAKIKTLTEVQGQGFGAGGPRNFQDMSDEERAKLREEMTARRDAFDKGMAEVLTPEQKETWAKLQGAKFEFPNRGFGGGQGGGQGGGRRRRPE